MEAFPRRDHPEALPQPPPALYESEISIDDTVEAREKISQLIENNIHPLVSVPVEFIENFERYGIHVNLKQDHISNKNYSFIAGTIGISPFLPAGEKRIVYEIDPTDIPIVPRFTGKDKKFHGVVGFPEGIPPHALRRFTGPETARPLPEERPH